MFKKISSTACLMCFVFVVHAQIEVAKIIGKNSEKYGVGFGAFLKLAFPISEGDDISVEIGASIFREKNSSTNGLAYVPLKLGYRYSINRTGSGFYVEPQMGYNVYGAYTTYDQTYIDKKINGFVGSATAGYLFQPIGNITFDLGLRFETIQFNGGSANSVAIRLSHYINLGRKRD